MLFFLWMFFGIIGSILIYISNEFSRIANVSFYDKANNKQFRYPTPFNIVFHGFISIFGFFTFISGLVFFVFGTVDYINSKGPKSWWNQPIYKKDE